MKTPFAPFFHHICTALAAALLLVLSASAGDLAVRVIDRSPDVRNLDTTDTLKWYADESIDYTVRPRRGKEAVSIPGDAVATWIIADPATGTNYLSAVAASQTSNSVTFHLPLGGAALPEGVDEWVSYVSLLQGTNFLGVIDRTRAECLWSPYTSAAALVPTNPLPELLRQFATTSYVAAADSALDERIDALEATISAWSAVLWFTNCASLGTTNRVEFGARSDVLLLLDGPDGQGSFSGCTLDLPDPRLPHTVRLTIMTCQIGNPATLHVTVEGSDWFAADLPDDATFELLYTPAFSSEEAGRWSYLSGRNQYDMSDVEVEFMGADGGRFLLQDM